MHDGCGGEGEGVVVVLGIEGRGAEDKGGENF